MVAEHAYPILTQSGSQCVISLSKACGKSGGIDFGQFCLQSFA